MKYVESCNVDIYNRIKNVKPKRVLVTQNHEGSC